jgi:hypothetical protein
MTSKFSFLVKAPTQLFPRQFIETSVSGDERSLEMMRMVVEQGKGK